MDRNTLPKDAAFKQMLHNVLENNQHLDALAHEQINDHNEHLLALQRRLSTLPPGGFKPGQIVQWKPGMQNRRFPRYGEPAIVVEVLNPAVFDDNADAQGSNLYREPLTLVLGIVHDDGDFMCWHYDGRRFELQMDTGATP